ncbi:hypothetical protein VCUG_02723 [Vavraia culicis subsp. floridensis]|uniref:Suppressor of forked domain-containing protein n=1 Tax=Vavraia culicis (isolate floridensis) TaxID=948595 RepID=L2GRR3_VAVCU|nr:uncharacterized protein VCUG_02723 [Vavraia culicis subsp. floridensis]ELA45790.1 hypothetical protein VCUG_02723 [Vavraia culicis subsp. floridensis]
MLEQRELLQDALQFIKRGKYSFDSSFFKHKYRIMRKVIADENANVHCSKLLCEAALLEKKQDLSGAEQIFKYLLRVINREYRTKSFVKYSKFLVRREELQLARKNYGKAIAQHLDVYEEYLSMERMLGDKTRIRRINEKYLQDSYMDARVWLELIEFEESMGEVEQAEYLFENALKVLKNGVDIIEQEYNKRKYKK